MPKRIEYNKLVRDRIPEIIEADGREYGIKVMDDAEYKQALLTKLIEEAQEVATADSDDERIKELADLQEVLDSIVTAFEISGDDIQKRQTERRQERGGFQKRIKLLWTQ